MATRKRNNSTNNTLAIQRQLTHFDGSFLSNESIEQGEAILLYHVCDSQNEAKTKADILNTKIMRTNLGNKLHCEVSFVFTNCAMSLNLQKFRNKIRIQTQECPCTICYVNNTNNFDLCLLQNIFNKFVNERVLQINFEEEYSTNINRQQLNSQIFDITTKHKDLQIIILVEEEDRYRIFVSFWVSKELTLEEQQTKLKNYKQILDNLFTSEIAIILNDNEVLIWKYHVSQIHQNLMISQIIIEKRARIIIKGQYNLIQKAKLEIETQIKQLQYFEESYNILNSLLLNIMSQEIINKINEKLLPKILEKQKYSFSIKCVKQNNIIFRIVCDAKQSKLVSKTIETLIIHQLDVLQINSQIDAIHQYYASIIQDFQNTYAVVCVTEENLLTVIGTSPTLELLSSLLIKFEKFQLPLSNNVVFNHLAQMYRHFNEQCLAYLEFNTNQINIWCQRESFDSILEQICPKIHQFQNQLVVDKFHSMFNNKLKEDRFRLTQFQKETNTFFNFQNVYQLYINLPQEEKRTIMLTNQDIFSIECDTYIIFGKDEILSTITGKIQSIKSPIVSNTLTYTQDQSWLNFEESKEIEELWFEDNVFSVNCSLQSIKKNLLQIFTKCEVMKFKTLALYINDNNLKEQFIKEISDYFLLSAYKHVQTLIISVYCREQSFVYFEEILRKQCVSLKHLDTGVQWQWETDDNMYTNYDSQSNEIIENLYKRFETSKERQQHVINLVFSSLSDIVDLEKMKLVWQKDNEQQEVQILSHTNNHIEFLLEGFPCEQELEQNFALFAEGVQIPIYQTQYQIQIDDNGMFQKNLNTNFIRKIRRIQKVYSEELNLVSLSHENNQKASNKLDKYIQSILSTLIIQLPNLSDSQMKEIMNFLQNMCWLINDQFQCGNQLQISFIQDNFAEIEQQLKQFQISYEIA